MTVMQSGQIGKKSCFNCPSKLDGPKQATTLGNNIAGPVCGSKMLAIVMPKQDEKARERLAAHRASGCDKFGVDVHIVPLQARHATNITIGFDVQAMTKSPDLDQRGANCRNCANFIGEAAVQSKTGWQGAICAATGQLMLPSRLENQAAMCGKYRRHVGVRPSIDRQFESFTLNPEYGDKFGVIDPAAQFRNAMRQIVEPKDHKTEAEVKPEHAKRGIISWRKILDPEGYGPPVFLPIYDIESFDPLHRKLVPKTSDDTYPAEYADHGQLLYKQAVLWMRLDETPAWWGSGGTGKTEFSRHLAWLMQLPWWRISITDSTELDDLIGRMMFIDGETRFWPGQLPTAWAAPGVILLDEPNTGPNAIWQRVRPLTDNSRTLILTEDDSRHIRRGEDTFFSMAMNPTWDPLNVGTNTIGDADNSRLAHMYFTMPPRDVEIEIIKRRISHDDMQIDDTQISLLMGVAEDIRKSIADNGAFHTSWGVRHNIKVARALAWFSPVSAYRIAVGDSLEPNQLSALLENVNRHFPS